MKTHAQHLMEQAAKRVADVKDASHQDIYGRLCHNFPVMVRTCGLCQAVAFSAAKAKDKKPERAQAHARILEDVEEITGLTPDDIPEVDVTEYMLQTRRLLAAWTYYKRFAVSILKVEAGSQEEDRDG